MTLSGLESTIPLQYAGAFMPAPEFKTNTFRYDPYKNFKFRVKFKDNDDVVAGISKVSGLKRTTEVVKHRVGGDPSSSRKSPGRTEYDPITLERGVTHDNEFEKWANKVWNFAPPNPSSASSSEVSLKDFRKDLILEVFNESGQPALRYIIYRCWVSEYHALPDLDANANAIAIQTIKLENEGWERDLTLVEPTEASYTIPSV
ncbi:MAG: phage tail protein [Schlesneria sp.]